MNARFTINYTAQDIHTESTQHSKGWERCDRLTIKELKRYQDIKNIIDDLDAEINELKSKCAIDVVKASYDKFPYTQHTLKITGNDEVSLSAIQILVSKKTAKKAELENLRIKIESFIDDIQDYQVRRIFKFKYIKGKSWQEVANIIGGNNTRESVRKIATRFLLKN